MYPQILLRRLFQRAVSANGKKGTKTAKAEVRALTAPLAPLLLIRRSEIGILPPPAWHVVAQASQQAVDQWTNFSTGS